MTYLGHQRFDSATVCARGVGWPEQDQNNVNCSDPVHIEETTRFDIAILGSLQDASSSVFQQAGNGRGGNYSNKPGWADYVSDLYKESRDIGKMWCNAGKPRQGQICDLYRQSKLICIYAIHSLHQTS